MKSIPLLTTLNRAAVSQTLLPSKMEIYSRKPVTCTMGTSGTHTTTLSITVSKWKRLVQVPITYS